MKVSNFLSAIRPSGQLRTVATLAAAALFFTGTVVWSQQPTGGSGRGGRAGSGRGRGGGGGLQADAEHPVMKIGSHIPDFTLPGADGKTHSLREWASSKFLMVVFECNHCPESQNYESRIKQLYEDYKTRGVQLVAINPNDPASVRLDELGYTDLEDSLPEMKVREADRHITWPYLYDGTTQNIATKFGVIATPHVFIFDQDRNLRFEGQIDNNQRPDLVTSRDTRAALEELLAGKPVTVTDTRVHGCSTKWKSKQVGSQSREAEMTKIHSDPVKFDAIDADALKKMKANGTGKVEVLTFWSTKCGTACDDTFHALETTYRMYRLRSFDFATVNTDPVANKDAVMAYLNKQHATSPNNLTNGKNYQATGDLASVQAAIGEKWKAGGMFTIVIGSDGKVLYKKEGLIEKAGAFPMDALGDATPSPDLLAFRRSILANMTDTAGYPGNKAYWMEDYAKVAAK
jgi:thiol-disulfide isomerase/thioredoxin